MKILKQRDKKQRIWEQKRLASFKNCEDLDQLNLPDCERDDEFVE
jgi:hypothetical protein